jgi:hypothetical protein
MKWRDKIEAALHAEVLEPVPPLAPPGRDTWSPKPNASRFAA